MIRLIGHEYSIQQATEFISKLQERDVIINPILFTRKNPQFEQAIRIGRFKKTKPSYFSRLPLLNGSLLGVIKSVCVCFCVSETLFD